MKSYTDNELRVSRIVGMNLKRLRAARELSLRALERETEKVGCPLSAMTLLSIEHDRRRVSVDDLVTLAAVFKVRPEQLLAPPECEACQDSPPPGFACRTCGTAG